MAAEATGADQLRLTLDEVEVLHLAAIGTIPGVRIVAAAGRNGPGVGRIRGDGTALQWRAPGSETFGLVQICGADGTYVLPDGEDGDKIIRVAVLADYLQGGVVESNVRLEEVWANGLAANDVTAGEALAGDVADYELALVNDGTICAEVVKVWLDAEAVNLEISLDGINWYSPTSEDHADVLVIASIGSSGGEAALYLRRTIAAESGSATEILNLIHWAWNGQ